MPLRKDVASPLAPRNDVEGEDAKDEKKDDEGARTTTAKKDDKAKDDAKKDDKADEEGAARSRSRSTSTGFEQRVVVLPPKAGQLRPPGGRLGQARSTAACRAPAPATRRARSSSTTSRSARRRRSSPTPTASSSSADGKKLLVCEEGRLRHRRAQGRTRSWRRSSPPASSRRPSTRRAEWRQIFTDAWRFERDYFYDPGMHGVDWNAMRERYGKLLDDAVTRWDVNYVIGELIAELNSSHTYRGGGDVEKPLERGVGLPGRATSRSRTAPTASRGSCDGAPWDSEVRSPLAAARASNVKEGDYLLAVNGEPLDVDAGPVGGVPGPGRQDRCC